MFAVRLHFSAGLERLALAVRRQHAPEGWSVSTTGVVSSCRQKGQFLMSLERAAGFEQNIAPFKREAALAMRSRRYCPPTEHRPFHPVGPSRRPMLQGDWTGFRPCCHCRPVPGLNRAMFRQGDRWSQVVSATWKPAPVSTPEPPLRSVFFNASTGFPQCRRRRVARRRRGCPRISLPVLRPCSLMGRSTAQTRRLVITRW